MSADPNTPRKRRAPAGRAPGKSAKSARVTAIPEKPTPDMLRAAEEALAMLGPFPVPEDIPSTRTLQGYVTTGEDKPDVRTENPARKAIEDLLHSYVLRLRRDQQAKTLRPKKLIALLTSLQRMSGQLKSALAGLSDVERNILTHPGMRVTLFRDIHRLTDKLTRSVGLSQDGKPLTLRDALPASDPQCLQRDRDDGPVVRLLDAFEAFVGDLADQLTFDLTDAGSKPLDRGGVTNVLRHRDASPAWTLTREAWRLWVRCPRVTPDTRGISGAASRDRGPTLYGFLLKIHEAATGVPAGDREMFKHEHVAIAQLMAEELELNRAWYALAVRMGIGDSMHPTQIVRTKVEPGKELIAALEARNRIPPEFRAEFAALNNRQGRLFNKLYFGAIDARGKPRARFFGRASDAL